jgi:hypothetical protein
MERMTDEETAEQRQEFEAQMQAALEVIQRAVLALLQAGEADPRLIVLALAHVTGEIAAAAALAGDEDLEQMLADIAEIVRQVGRGHHQDLQTAALPAAGNA